MSTVHPDGVYGSDGEGFNCGKLSREDAIRVLTGHPDGTFILRSSASMANAYTISVLRHGIVQHLRIKNMPGGYAINSSDPPCTHLDELIAAAQNKKLHHKSGTGRSAGGATGGADGPTHICLNQALHAAATTPVPWHWVTSKTTPPPPGEPPRIPALARAQHYAAQLYIKEECGTNDNVLKWHGDEPAHTRKCDGGGLFDEFNEFLCFRFC